VIFEFVIVEYVERLANDCFLNRVVSFSNVPIDSTNEQLQKPKVYSGDNHFLSTVMNLPFFGIFNSCLLFGQLFCFAFQTFDFECIFSEKQTDERDRFLFNGIELLLFKMLPFSVRSKCILNDRCCSLFAFDLLTLTS